MKKKNRKTFSQRAQDLVKKYNRASFDKNERDELDAALKKLAEEQELYKQVHKIGEYSDEAMQQRAIQQQEMLAQQQAQQQDQMLDQQQAQQSQMQSHEQFLQGSPQGTPMQMDGQIGQMPQFDGRSGTSKLGESLETTNPNYFMYMNNNQMRQVGQNSYSNPNYYYQENTYHKPNTVVLNALSPTGAAGAKYIQKQNNADNYIAVTNAYNNNSKATQSVAGQNQQLGMTQSILPSVIAGGVGMLGNIILGATTKPHPFDFKQRYSAEQISLAKERERLSREATTARNIGMRNLRNAGNRGAYLAGAGNVSAAVNQNLSDGLSKSYFNEGMTNMNQREKAYDKNFDLNKRIAIMNYQDKINALNERRAYYAAAAGQVGEIMKDINGINFQNNALLSLGTDNYLAGTNTKYNMWKPQQIMRKFKKD